MNAAPQLTADALRDTFPGYEDAPLAIALLVLLAHGRPVTTAALAQAVGRSLDEVAGVLARWPNVERGTDGAVVGCSGLTLKRTPHSFEVGGQLLHTWCAWDTLFLPALLNATARVSSMCPQTGRAVELVVAPDGIEHAEPETLHVSFPPPAATDTANITASFCCHVHFLAGGDAARDWQQTHPDGEVLELADAFALGRGAVAPLTEPRAGSECC